jgi:hypothetical protein
VEHLAVQGRKRVATDPAQLVEKRLGVHRGRV